MKQLKSIDDPMFQTLEKDQLKKITGGLLDDSSQHSTYTVRSGGAGGDDGCDTLSSGEHQDSDQTY